MKIGFFSVFKQVHSKTIKPASFYSFTLSITRCAKCGVLWIFGQSSKTVSVL